MPLTPRQELTQLLERVGESRALYELGVHRTTLMRWRTGREVFTPGDLMALRYMRAQIDALERERREMQAKIDAMAQDPSVRGASANDAAIAYVPAA